MKLKGNILVALVVTVTNLFADISVSDVKVFSGYPWKEVAIGYTITGSTDQERTLDVTATDNTNGKTYVCWKLEGVDCTPGRHVVKWNPLADGVKIASNNVTFKVRVIPPPPLYCVIDISGGMNATSYPVTRLESVPPGGWTDEYKTAKLVLRRIEAGTFMMGSAAVSHQVTLTKPFYIGVFELTIGQYVLVMGKAAPGYHGDTKPMQRVSYSDVRGRGDGCGWPEHNRVDAGSFFGRLREKTGLEFDLPTEAQWEYACRAGTTSDFNDGSTSISEVGLYAYNGGFERDIRSAYLGAPLGPGIVGTFLPNAWGLYDMHGNIAELCLDFYGDVDGVIDPRGPDSGSRRVLRGGSWWSYEEAYCTSSHRSALYPNDVDSNIGFRVAWSPCDKSFTFQE